MNNQHNIFFVRVLVTALNVSNNPPSLRMFKSYEGDGKIDTWG